MVSQSHHGSDEAGGSVFVFYWMFDKKTDIMRATDSLQQRGTILRKLTQPLCIAIRRMAPMDVGGIFELIEKNKFDFQVERSFPPCCPWQLSLCLNVACTAAGWYPAVQFLCAFICVFIILCAVLFFFC